MSKAIWKDAFPPIGMKTLTNQRWGDVQEGDVLVNIYTGARRKVLRVDQAQSRGYLVITTDTRVMNSNTDGGHKLSGELTIERGCK